MSTSRFRYSYWATVLLAPVTLFWKFCTVTSSVRSRCWSAASSVRSPAIWVFDSNTSRLRRVSISSLAWTTSGCFSM